MTNYTNEDRQLAEETVDLLLNRKTRTTFNTPLNRKTWKCYTLAEKDNTMPCKGYEPLPQVSYDSIRWNAAGVTTLETSSTEYECLVSYYDEVANYCDIASKDMHDDGDFIVENNIEKFRSIYFFGYNYTSANIDGKDGYFCAYHYNDIGEKVLRPGQIQYSFTHTLGSKHYFAFVLWNSV